MSLKEWWKSQKYWAKGLVIGIILQIIIFAAYSFPYLISSSVFDPISANAIANWIVMFISTIAFLIMISIGLPYLIVSIGGNVALGEIFPGTCDLKLGCHPPSSTILNFTLFMLLIVYIGIFVLIGHWMDCETAKKTTGMPARQKSKKKRAKRH